MSITTKGGDKGQTSLFSGERVSKDDLRVEAYGTVDELDAHLGDACNYIQDEAMLAQLRKIQELLNRIMGMLASTDKAIFNPITDAEVIQITQLIYQYENLVPIQGFVIPGTTKASAKLDICRTIARRAERRITSLKRQTHVPDEPSVYINRLSDLFFILARYLEKQAGTLKYKENKNR